MKRERAVQQNTIRGRGKSEQMSCCHGLVMLLLRSDQCAGCPATTATGQQLHIVFFVLYGVVIEEKLDERVDVKEQ